LNDEAAHSESLTGGLKHGTGSSAHIVLAPQPSEDVNDPLNWSALKKEICMVILVLGSMLNAATIGPLLNSSLVVIAIDLHPDPTLGQSITTIVVSSGYNLLAVGCSGPIYCAFSRKYGKRPVFLVSTIFGIIGTAVGEASGSSFPALLAARIIQGFSTSAFESLIIAAVGDLYFVHQRGIRVAFITFILNASSSLASIICGQVTTGLGWVWLFHLLQIFLVVQLILMFLFCPETTYIRDHSYDIDQVQDENLGQLVEQEHRHDVNKEAKDAGPIQSNVSATAPRPKKTFVQELAVFSGKYTNDNFFILLAGPFVSLLNLGACWSTIASGLLTTWYVTSAIIQAGIFAGPPWGFDAAQIGYLSTGPFVGGAVGSAIIAFTSDPAAKWLTKMNKGI
jgi:MFS family permease